jgi:amino acid permease
MDASVTMASGKIDWGIVGFVFSIVALVLSVPLGIASHLLAHRFLAYLEKRKLIKSNRSKEQEIANYKRVEAFKNGTMDRYPYYILLATAAVISAVGSATCLVLVILKYWNAFDFPDFPLLLTLLLTFPFGVFAAVFMVVIAETAKHIEQFEQYQAEIRKKWGDDVI